MVEEDGTLEGVTEEEAGARPRRLPRVDEVAVALLPLTAVAGGAAAVGAVMVDTMATEVVASIIDGANATGADVGIMTGEEVMTASSNPTDIGNIPMPPSTISL